MQWLTPKGTWPLEHRSIFYVAGRYAATAPSGSYDLVVTRGPEYRAHRSKVQLAAAGPNDLVVQLERYDDMPAAGWYSGESHVHLMRERTEDMDVWNLLAAEDLYVSNLVEMGNITTTYFPQPNWGRRASSPRAGASSFPARRIRAPSCAGIRCTGTRASTRTWRTPSSSITPCSKDPRHRRGHRLCASRRGLQRRARARDRRALRPRGVHRGAAKGASTRTSGTAS